MRPGIFPGRIKEVMNEISDERLLELNVQGLIPGPMEGEKAFLERVAYCLNLKSHLNINSSQEILSNPSKDLGYYYNICISWIPVVFSNEKLAFWHGGCAWIFQETENTPTAALIQLRQVFARKKHYLRLYDREELLRHELVHVGRMVFEEPRFEEVLAYGTSKYGFRRLFGPLIQAPWESIVFVLTLAILFVFDLFLFSTGQSSWFEVALTLKIIPLTMILLALIRLFRKRWQYQRCLSKLESVLESAFSARSVAFRLTDAEICAFGGFTEEQLLEYAERQAKEELRWRVIYLAYFR